MSTPEIISTPADIFDLTGKRALVTGASRGIGRAVAVGFAARGARVLGAARSEDDLAETARLAEQAGGAVETHATDLRDPAAIEACVGVAVERLGGLDILVNNAGDDHDASIEDTDLSIFQRVLELNLQTYWAMCKAASPHLKDGGGKVINVASMLGLVGIRDNAHYIASKHGVVGLTRALSLEWARSGVQVNAIAPGFIRTAMTDTALGDERILRYITRNTPEGRVAEAEEIVGTAVYLATSASNFMTGQVLVVDGGWTAQ